MKIRTFSLALLLGMMVSSSAFAWRFGLDSLWPTRPVQIDGEAIEWADLPVVEEYGVSFRAMNDDSNLYLLLRATTDNGRSLMAGKFRQNICLWFLNPDRKTKVWGIDLDFGPAHAPGDEEVSPTLASYGIAPKLAAVQGLAVSSAPFPSDMELQTDLSTHIGRQPVYEMRIPLSKLQKHGRDVYVDFTTSNATAEVNQQIRKMNRGQSDHPKKLIIGPTPILLHLTVVLAKRS